MISVRRILLFLFAGTFILGCTTVDLFEKSVAIPDHAWKSDFKPEFNFTIKDSSAAYDIFLVLRHNDKYSFNNIYINLYAKTPVVDSLSEPVRYDLKLGSDEKGWLNASGMDDIYEHRIKLTEGQPAYFRQTGNYTFKVEQIMREDPLKNVLNVGIRIEKKK